MTPPSAAQDNRSAAFEGPPRSRKIIHVDMDAFFTSVEQLDDPSLKGRPLVVGGAPERRGVVAAASYEARAFGVRSAMPMSRAVSLCPDLIRRPPRFDRYLEVSRQVRAILEEASPLIEPISLDEAFLDVTALNRPASEIAAALKAEIVSRVGLTASAGVGPNKLVAKIASDFQKPDGLTVVPPARVTAFLAPLPVSRLWGVGPVTERRLLSLGFSTIGQLAHAEPRDLAAKLGSTGAMLVRMARGEDDRPVTSYRKTRSISCERTLDEDTLRLDVLDGLLARFAAELQAALREERMAARTVVLKLRYSDFKSLTRSHTEPWGCDAEDRILAAARDLLARTEAGRRRVRLVGLGVSNLTDAGEPIQRSLFGAEPGRILS